MHKGPHSAFSEAIAYSHEHQPAAAAFVWLVNSPFFSDSSATSALAEAVPGEARCISCIFWAYSIRGPRLGRVLLGPSAMRVSPPMRKRACCLVEERSSTGGADHRNSYGLAHRRRGSACRAGRNALQAIHTYIHDMDMVCRPVAEIVREMKNLNTRRGVNYFYRYSVIRAL